MTIYSTLIVSRSVISTLASYPDRSTMVDVGDDIYMISPALDSMLPHDSNTQLPFESSTYTFLLYEIWSAKQSVIVKKGSRKL